MRRETHHQNTQGYQMKETGSPIHAKVVLCRCSEARKEANLFGLRIEERGGDWLRTWAFKVDEGKAKREGFDTERTTGSINPADNYPGCPYCSGMAIAQCGCGKLFCIHGELTRDEQTGQTVMKATCPWCGQQGIFFVTDKLNVQGGGM
jgi:hypothetical protein